MKSPAANISQAIAGKISGVITSQTSGAPGADDMKIYIRGRASFAGDNQPLILVDGVEREFSQIAPDDIESISTLKDASRYCRIWCAWCKRCYADYNEAW
ncbi:TonB-dependent receptor plug domain-containing protein [Bacteroides thetaiotaomicron]|nr:TonB-dependent receptor plug domain-containing protein [Bacteroides thetaiotaomicron]